MTNWLRETYTSRGQPLMVNTPMTMIKFIVTPISAIITISPKVIVPKLALPKTLSSHLVTMCFFIRMVAGFLKGLMGLLIYLHQPICVTSLRKEKMVWRG